MEFWCEQGLCAAPKVEFLKKNLKTHVTSSEKKGKFTRVRTWDNAAGDHKMSQYHGVITIVTQYPNTKVKYITVPCFFFF